MAEAARDLSKQEQEAPRSEGEKKPELRIVTEEEAPSMIDRMVDEFEEGAESGTKEMQTEAQGLEQFAADKGGFDAGEASQNVDIAIRAVEIKDKLRQELAAANDGGETAKMSVDQMMARARDVDAMTKNKSELQVDKASPDELLAAAVRQIDTATDEVRDDVVSGRSGDVAYGVLKGIADRWKDDKRSDEEFLAGVHVRGLDAEGKRKLLESGKAGDLRKRLVERFSEPEKVVEGPRDLKAIEAEYRSLNEQLETADRKGDKAALDKLSARLAEVKAERSTMEAAVKQKEATESLVPATDEAQPVSGERAKAEAKVAPDFGQLLEHLSPEAQAAAAKNFAEADEEAYGGLASKGMTPDGVVRLGYKDGTIVEVFPGGQRRSNLPEAKGAERIPELPAYLQEAEPMGPAEGEVGLITLEEDMIAEQEELLQLESGAGVPGSEARRAELRASIGKKSEQIRAKSTPEGLAKEVAAMQALIATEEADMNLAPEEERGGYATRIDQWKQQQEDLEGRLAAAKAKASPETQPAGAAVEAKAEAPKRESALERKDKMVKLEAHLRELEDARKKAPTPEAKKAIEQQLEDSTKEWEALKNEWTPEDEAEYQEAQAEKAKQEQVLALEGRMRELEQQYKEATDPDKKAAIARDLEATTREWDALRAKPVSKKGAPKRATKAIEGAAALVAAAETMAAAAETIADTTEKQAEKKEEMDKAKEAEKSALGKIGGYAGEYYTGGGGGGSSGGGGGYGGGGGGGKEKGALGKKLEAAWDWAQKFFGGWTGVK